MYVCSSVRHNVVNSNLHKHCQLTCAAVRKSVAYNMQTGKLQ